MIGLFKEIFQIYIMHSPQHTRKGDLAHSGRQSQYRIWLILHSLLASLYVTFFGKTNTNAFSLNGQEKRF